MVYFNSGRIVCAGAAHTLVMSAKHASFITGFFSSHCGVFIWFLPFPSLPISFPLVSVMGAWFPFRGGSWLGGADFQPWGRN